MSDDDTKVPLPDLENGSDVQVVQDAGTLAPSDSETVNRGAADLEAVFDVPVQVSAVLGRAHMEVGNLLKLGPGAVLELDSGAGPVRLRVNRPAHPCAWMDVTMGPGVWRSLRGACRLRSFGPIDVNSRWLN